LDIYEQLRRDEGLRLRPYLDSVGKTTIGYGRNLSGKGISKEEAEIFLVNDVKEVSDLSHSRLPWFQALDPVRQGVLLNMVFNMEFKVLDGFPRMLQAVAQGQWETAADEMRDSLWAKQVGDRAVRLEQQMRTGIWV
jgi:lysozyme